MDLSLCLLVCNDPECLYIGQKGTEGVKGITYIGVLQLAMVATQPMRMLIYIWGGVYCDWLWWGLNQSECLYVGQKGAEGMTYIRVLWLTVVGTQPISECLYIGQKGTEGTEGMTYIGVLWLAVVETQPIRMLIIYRGQKGMEKWLPYKLQWCLSFLLLAQNSLLDFLLLGLTL